MLKIQIQKITLNYEKINQIKNNTLDYRFLSLLKKNGTEIINRAKTQMPYSLPQLREKSSFYKNKSYLPHLRDRYALQKETQTSFRFNGEKLPTWNIKIQPNKLPKSTKSIKTYPFVMAAGVRLGKKINYSNPNAKPFYIEREYKKQKNQITIESENLILRMIQNDFGKN